MRRETKIMIVREIITIIGGAIAIIVGVLLGTHFPIYAAFGHSPLTDLWAKVGGLF